jgi:hypothetical protein
MKKRQFDLFALILAGKTFFGHYSKLFFQNQLHHCLIITKVQLSSILRNQYDISTIKLILAMLTSYFNYIRYYIAAQ